MTAIETSKRIAVILPAFNEEQTIAETIIAFHQALPQADIWVVNNRSTDATSLLASSTLAQLSCNGGVIDEYRAGKGNAVRRAFMEVEADIYVLVDADMTYPAAQASLLITPLLNNQADMVVGDRHTAGHYAKENKRSLHNMGNHLVKSLVNWLFNANLADIMSGYRAFTRRFIKSYPILAEGYEIETEMTLHALDKRFRIAEIPVRYQERPVGSFSKLNTLSDGIKVLLTIGNILRLYRPLAFFGSISLAFFLLGLLAGLPVIAEYLNSHFIKHLPLAVLATGLEIFSITLISIGLILDSMAQQDKRNYERQLLSLDKKS